MSETAFEYEFLATPDVSTHLPAPLRARPFGVRAALGMGGAASVILLATMAFVTPRRDADPANAQQAAGATNAIVEQKAPAPAKIAAKIDASTPTAQGRSATQSQSAFSAFDLAAPEFAQEKKMIGVRDGDDGAGRVDSITIGQFEAGATFMRVDLHQGVTEKEANADFFLDMTRHAARLGLNVAKIGAPFALQTRFGDFEAADIKLTQPAAEGVAASERACLAARFIDPKTSFIAASLACGSPTLSINRATFGCLLGHLDYKAGAADGDALAALFQKAASPGASACNGAEDVETTASIPARGRAHSVHGGHTGGHVGRRRHR